MTTAAGITAVVDLVLSSPRKYQGFVAQEQFDLPEILDNRFGQYYAPGGTKDRFLDGRGQRPGRPSAPARARRRPPWRGHASSEAQEMSAAKQYNVDVAGILKRLGIDSINAGAWSGNLGWSKDIAGQRHHLGQSRHRRNARASARRHGHGLRSRHAQRASRRPPPGATCPRRAAAKPSAC